ncbi:MAG: NAD(P)-dependent oxidoreductase, partial [Promethearchaeota archaeon]
MKQKIGWIGTGVMGKSMCSHIIKAGYEVSVYNRTKRKAEGLIEMGAIWRLNPKEVAENSNIIFTIVGYPKDVEEVYFGEMGIISSTKPNSIIVDMTTSEPTLAKKIYEQAKIRNVYSIDAPVSGGDIGA